MKKVTLLSLPFVALAALFSSCATPHAPPEVGHGINHHTEATKAPKATKTTRVRPFEQPHPPHFPSIPEAPC